LGVPQFLVNFCKILLLKNENDFICEVYKAILNRPVDEDRRTYYLTALKTGKLIRFEIILEMMKSSEVRKNKSFQKGIVGRKISNKIFH
jgi:hypothetical protein